MPKSNISSVNLSGVKVRFSQRGNGPPVLLLHGGEGPFEDRRFVDLLSEQFNVIIPTHPGFGGTLIPEHFDHISDLVFLYLDFLDELNLQKVVLVGFSMGGWIAAEIAIRNDSRLAQLVLVDAVGVKVGGREERDIADVFALSYENLIELTFHNVALAPTLETISEEELQIIAANRTALGVYTWEPYMHNPKLVKRLHRIKVPTDFIWGRSDRIVSADYGQKYCSMIRNAKMTILDKAGHLPHLETPDVFADTIFNIVKN